MNNIKTIVTIVLFAIICASCKQGKVVEHERGFKYIAHKRTEYGLSPRVGDIAIFKLKITTPNDSIIENTDYVQTQVKQPPENGGTIDDALMFMNRGDSIAFFLNAATYYAQTLNEDMPEFMTQIEELRFDIMLIDVMTTKQFEEQRRQALSTGKLGERVFMDEYLSKVSSKRIEIDSMLYWISQKEGTGKNIKANDIVELHYIAYFIDGKVFSNTYQNDKPFVFSVGDDRIMEAFNKTMPYLKLNSKGRMIVPSYLGYGEAGKDNIIPPFSSLIFDIEVVGVTQR